MRTPPTRSNSRTIFVCCDGLGRDWITADATPTLYALMGASTWCSQHSAVFPSVTRVSAASIATGCHPGHHGLHGNRMALAEEGRLVVRDVGRPDFREHMRRATGATLRVPCLAERVRGAGGFVAFSNVSPGAAYFLDPDHHGFVHHRAGSFGPDARQLSGSDHLDVSHDLAGDVAMTTRFCTEVVAGRRPGVGILWLANPDLTLHSNPLGSTAHLEAMRTADTCVARVMEAVAQQRQAGDDVLLVIGSDHGHETIHSGIDITGWLSANGCADLIAGGQLAVAAQGTSALIYASPVAASRFEALAPDLARQPWAGRLVLGDELVQVGLSEGGDLIAAIDMARADQSTASDALPGRYVATDGEKPPELGCGQHGGLGANEMRPFLAIDHPLVSPRRIATPTSLIDIAPTILAFLDLPADGVDGQAIVAPPPWLDGALNRRLET
jgi:hypothetical protein